MKKMIVIAALAASAAAEAEILTLRGKGGDSCRIDTQGARIVSCRLGGRERVWMPEAPTDSPVWRHGGIPIAWPWFGRIGNGDGAIHGYAWKNRFAVKERGDGRVALEFKTETAVLEYVAEFDGDGLSLVLRTTNRSAFTMPFGAAFHPYFRVAERDGVRIDGLYGTTLAVDKAVDGGPDFDRVAAGRRLTLRDTAAGCALCLTVSGATGANVWNPGPEKNCPGSIPGDEWRRFVSLEPILSGRKGMVPLNPGETRELSMRLAAE